MEFDHAVDESEEGVIAADADVLAGVVGGAALADDDVAGDALLAAKDFDAKSFAFGFATVAGTTYTFFVSHIFLILNFEL